MYHNYNISKPKREKPRFVSYNLLFGLFLVTFSLYIIHLLFLSDYITYEAISYNVLDKLIISDPFSTGIEKIMWLTRFNTIFDLVGRISFALIIFLSGQALKNKDYRFIGYLLVTLFVTEIGSDYLISLNFFNLNIQSYAFSAISCILYLILIDRVESFKSIIATVLGVLLIFSLEKINSAGAIPLVLISYIYVLFSKYELAYFFFSIAVGFAGTTMSLAFLPIYFYDYDYNTSNKKNILLCLMIFIIVTISFYNIKALS